MIHMNAVIYARKGQELMCHKSEGESPVVYQLGGNDPDNMATAAKIAENYGFDEININCGCPSTKAGKGAFGATLMKDPLRVAEIASKMQSEVSVPVTVKC